MISTLPRFLECRLFLQVPIFLATRGLSESKWAFVVDSFRTDVLSLTNSMGGIGSGGGGSGGGGGGLCSCLFAFARAPDAERKSTLDACRAWLVR